MTPGADRATSAPIVAIAPSASIAPISDAASAPLVGRVAVPSSASATPLVFGSERVDTPFPFAGAALLIALLAVAAWAWWRARGGFGVGVGIGMAQPAAGVRRWLGPLASPASRGDAARVVTSTRFDTGGRLHVVEWHGEQWLLAVNGAAQPVVVARKPMSAMSTTGISP